MDQPSHILVFAMPVVMCIVIIFVCRSMIRAADKAEKILRQWEERNQFELLRAEKCFFCGGFNPLTTSKTQTVYDVTIRDRKGQERSGWVRCGSYWSGVWEEKSEVKWKDG